MKAWEKMFDNLANQLARIKKMTDSTEMRYENRRAIVCDLFDAQRAIKSARRNFEIAMREKRGEE